jgi:hypothetical protein
LWRIESSAIPQKYRNTESEGDTPKKFSVSWATEPQNLVDFDFSFSVAKKCDGPIPEESGLLSADYECGINGCNSKQKISTDWRNIFGRDRIEGSADRPLIAKYAMNGAQLQLSQPVSSRLVTGPPAAMVIGQWDHGTRFQKRVLPKLLFFPIMAYADNIIYFWNVI